MTSSTARRSVLSFLLTLLLVLPGTAALAAEVSPDDDPETSAAAWLAARYQDNGAVGFGPGSLADLIFALAAASTGSDAAQAALADLEAQVDAYVGTGAETKPGALGKVLLAVEVMGADPTDFGGRNLEQELRDRMLPTGQFDSSAFNQALAILGLAATDAGVPGEAVTFLASLQCGDGSFGYFGCPGDVDTTGLALQALIAGGQDPADDSSSAHGAVGYLLAQQAESGAFESSPGAEWSTQNANSTGVAAQALRAGGSTAAADDAAGYVTSLQFGCDADTSVQGAIRYNEATTADQFQSIEGATLQGLLAYGAARYDTLTIAGADATAPTIVCAAPEPSPSPTETTSPSPSPAATDTPTPAADVSPTASGTGAEEQLAETGAEPVWLGLLALALLAGGIVSLRGRGEQV